MEANRQNTKVFRVNLSTGSKSKNGSGKNPAVSSPGWWEADEDGSFQKDGRTSAVSSISKDHHSSVTTDGSRIAGIKENVSNNEIGLASTTPMNSVKHELNDKKAILNKTITTTTNGTGNNQQDVKQSASGSAKTFTKISDGKSNKTSKTSKPVATSVGRGINTGGRKKSGITQPSHLQKKDGFTTTKHAIHAANFITSAVDFEKTSDVDMKVLTGSVHGIPPLSSNIVRIFISSTFSGRFTLIIKI